MVERAEVRDPLAYMFAGRAVVTIANVETGNRFTYKVKRMEGDDGVVRYFINLLRGPDNEDDYSYMGMMVEGQGRGMITTRASKVTERAVSFQAFNWVLAALRADRLPEKIKIYHEGRCGRCGRRLTVPESIEMGLGPECAKRA